MAVVDKPSKEPRADVPEDVRGALVTVLQFFEKLSPMAFERPLDAMDLNDAAFEEELQILRDAAGYTDGETYASADEDDEDEEDEEDEDEDDDFEDDDFDDDEDEDEDEE